MGVHVYFHILPTLSDLAKWPPATTSRLLIPFCNAVVVHFRFILLIVTDHIVSVIAQLVMVTPVPAAHRIGSSIR